MFIDRRDAGRQLAEQLAERLGRRSPRETLVAALPRGGVPVGVEVSAVLGVPIDVLVVRKLGHPRQPELGLGAIAEGGVRLLNEPLLRRLRVDLAALEDVATRETAELERRVVQYRLGRPPLPVDGRTVIVVDDGMATGLTALTAVEQLRRRGAASVVVGAPVAARATAALLREAADAMVCVAEPAQLRSVNQWYEDFAQVPDEVVVRLLSGGPGRPLP